MGTLLNKLLGGLLVAARQIVVIFAVFVIGFVARDFIFDAKKDAESLLVKREDLTKARHEKQAAASSKRASCDAIRDQLADVIKRRPRRSRIPGTTSNSTKIALTEAFQQCDRVAKALKKDVADVESSLANIDPELQRNFWKRYIEPSIAPAFLALAALYAAPLGIRLFLYFVASPVLSGGIGVRVLPGAAGKESSPAYVGKSSSISTKTQDVALSYGEELLVKPNFLQSTPLTARKSTAALLNLSIPLSSISSGMYLLTRLDKSGDKNIVVSSMTDSLEEVAIVEIPEGSAFVCLPRCLVGVVQHRDRPIHISKHWNIFSRQAWLTMRLRFLVFHGPGKLIVGGRRGVRMENAQSLRLINQEATIGFSANLAYGSARCETFSSYWAGHDGLFSTVFSGDQGVYVYEDIPGVKRTSLASRLEYIPDAILKVFGI